MTVYKVLVPHNGRKGWVTLDTSTTIERLKAQALVRAGYLKEVTDDAAVVPDPDLHESGLGAVPARPVQKRRKKSQSVPEVTDVDVEAEPVEHPQDGEGEGV